MRMRILVACEFSGVVRQAFAARGCDAWSCDLLDTELPGHHMSTDVLGEMYPTPSDSANRGLPSPILSPHRWDLLIAHPPCQYLSNSGIRWLYKAGRKVNGKDVARWTAMRKGAKFLLDLWTAGIKHICIEQPEIHIHAQAIIEIPVTQSIQPWMFGHWETKETCLRLKNLPPLVPTYATEEECRIALGLPEGSKPKPRVHHASPGPNRWKERSRTLPGIARAMAEQWGTL